MKTTRHVIASEYQKLVKFNPSQGLWRLFLTNKQASVLPINVSKNELKNTFEQSVASNKGLIACDSQEHAQRIAGCLKMNHDASPDFIEHGVKIFASPVVYTVEVEDRQLPEVKPFEDNDIIDYADTRNIPLYAQGGVFVPTSEEVQKSVKIQSFKDDIQIRKLVNLTFDQVTEASYLGADGTQQTVDFRNNFSMDWEIVGHFMAVLGTAAVALAFAVLGAATLALPGVVVASVGAAVGLAGLGLFAYGVMNSAPKASSEGCSSDHCSEAVCQV